MWFFDAEANGFVRTWNKQRVFADDDDSPSRVFLNPPGGKCDPNGRALVKVKSGYAYANTGELCTLPSQSSVKAWWFKLAREYVSRRVSEAIFVGFSIEILQQTQVNTPAGLPTPLDFYLCFPSRRVAYVKPDGEVGESPPHASVLVYLGPNADRFRVAFSPLGRVIPWH